MIYKNVKISVDIYNMIKFAQEYLRDHGYYYNQSEVIDIAIDTLKLLLHKVK